MYEPLRVFMTLRSSSALVALGVWTRFLVAYIEGTAPATCSR